MRSKYVEDAKQVNNLRVRSCKVVVVFSEMEADDIFILKLKASAMLVNES